MRIKNIFFLGWDPQFIFSEKCLCMCIFSIQAGRNHRPCVLTKFSATKKNVLMPFLSVLTFGANIFLCEQFCILKFSAASPHTTFLLWKSDIAIWFARSRGHCPIDMELQQILVDPRLWIVRNLEQHLQKTMDLSSISVFRSYLYRNKNASFHLWYRFFGIWTTRFLLDFFANFGLFGIRSHTSTFPEFCHAWFSLERGETK